MTIDYQAKYEDLLRRYDDLLERYAAALRMQQPQPIVYPVPTRTSWPTQEPPIRFGIRSNDPLPPLPRIWCGDPPGTVSSGSSSARDMTAGGWELQG